MDIDFTGTTHDDIYTPDGETYIIRFLDEKYLWHTGTKQLMKLSKMGISPADTKVINKMKKKYGKNTKDKE